MVRPTLLVVEPEPVQALSVRKLVLETAKFNVLTAHSTAEALELMKLFPNVSAAVVALDRSLKCEEIVRSVKRELKGIPTIVVTAQISRHCPGADHHVPSHEPEMLVELVRSLLGDPREIDGHKHEASNPQAKHRRH